MDSPEAVLRRNESPPPPIQLVDGSTGRAGHDHRSGRADQRVWLERFHDEAATMELHPYCLDCGAVRSMQPMRGRPMGFFERWLVNLKRILEDHPKYGKLAQVHSRLIAQTLQTILEFGDPYSMPFDAQRTSFLAAVQKLRRDLPIEFLEDAMPGEPRHQRPAFIDLIARTHEAKPADQRAENRPQMRQRPSP